MVLNYNNRILHNFILKQRIPTSVLAVSAESIHLPGIKSTEHFFVKKTGILPFPSQSFDFVYCRDPLEIFQNPCQMYAELLRVGKRGLIQNKSPLDLILNRVEGIPLVFWTDVYSNTLCSAPYHPKVPEMIQIEDWDRICLNKPYFLSDWYSWESSSEFNIRMYNSFEDLLDYQLLYEESISESVKNTINVLGKTHVK